MNWGITVNMRHRSLDAIPFNKSISANIEMRIANEPSFIGAIWEPLKQEKPWILSDGPVGAYIVYVQFRDGVGNESFIVNDTIMYTPTIYLPIIKR